MNKFYIDFEATQKFEPIFLDYIQQKPQLLPFYACSPTIENFEKQAQQKANHYTAAQRQLLHQALTEQYSTTAHPPKIALDLLLQPNTFTLTTGHQLNIFTGPLYFHYKIMTVIQAAAELRKKYPHYNFVPVYWMASEDHDAEEISFFRLWGKKYTWQAEQQGAVGRFAPQSLLEVARKAPEMDSLLTKAYQKANTLAEATRWIVNELYGAEGLVIIDGDDALLKKSFTPLLKKELTTQFSYKAMTQTSEQLAALQYKIQVNPREINLFYLDHQVRERIVQEVENEQVVYKVLHTDLQWTSADFLALLETAPQKFSPNVVLRPLYQEHLLPNVSYTGGPGELAYWLQLKEVFTQAEVPFPLLLPRNHVLYLTKQDQANLQAKLTANHLPFTAIFQSAAELKKMYLAKVLQNPTTIETELAAWEQIGEQITEKLKKTDATLEKYGKAQQVAMKKIAEKLQKKLQKAQELRFEADLRQLETLHQRLCPNGGLQERTDNYLSFSLNNPNFLKSVSQQLNPFDWRFVVLEE